MTPGSGRTKRQALYSNQPHWILFPTEIILLGIYSDFLTTYSRPGVSTFQHVYNSQVFYLNITSKLPLRWCRGIWLNSNNERTACIQYNQ